MDKFRFPSGILADLPEVVHKITAVVSVLITLLIIIQCVKTYFDHSFSLMCKTVCRGQCGEKY